MVMDWLWPLPMCARLMMVVGGVGGGCVLGADGSAACGDGGCVLGADGNAACRGASEVTQIPVDSERRSRLKARSDYVTLHCSRPTHKQTHTLPTVLQGETEDAWPVPVRQHAGTQDGGATCPR